MMLSAELLLQLALPGIVAGLVAWGTVRAELSMMKRAIEAAHDRLDKINAPAAKVRL
jgi:hypothetical protein